MRTYSYEGGSGNLLHIVSCPDCGSKQCMQPDLIEGMIYVPAGMLKAHFEFAPKVELWAANKASSIAPVSVSVESYEENRTLEHIGELLENLDQR